MIKRLRVLLIIVFVFLAYGLATPGFVAAAGPGGESASAVELKKKDADIRALKDIIAKLKASEEKLKTSEGKLRDTVGASEAKQSQTVKDFEARLSASEAKLKASEEKLKTSEGKLRDTVIASEAKQSQTVKDFEAKLAASDAKLAAKEKEIASSASGLLAMTEKLKASEGKLRDTVIASEAKQSQAVKDFEAKLAASEAKLAAKEKEIASSASGLLAMTGKLKDAEEKLKAVEGKLRDTVIASEAKQSQTVKDFEAKLSASEAKLAAKETEIASSASGLLAMTGKLKDAEEKLKASEGKLRDTVIASEAKQSQTVKDFEAKLAASDAKLAAKEKEIASSASGLLAMTGKLKDAENKLRAKDDELNKVKEDSRKAADARKQDADERAKINARIEALKAAVASADKKAAELEAKQKDDENALLSARNEKDKQAEAIKLKEEELKNRPGVSIGSGEMASQVKALESKLKDKAPAASSPIANDAAFISEIKEIRGSLKAVDSNIEGLKGKREQAADNLKIAITERNRARRKSDPAKAEKAGVDIRRLTVERRAIVEGLRKAAGEKESLEYEIRKKEEEAVSPVATVMEEQRADNAVAADAAKAPSDIDNMRKASKDLDGRIAELEKQGRDALGALKALAAERMSTESELEKLIDEAAAAEERASVPNPETAAKKLDKDLKKALAENKRFDKSLRRTEEENEKLRDDIKELEEKLKEKARGVKKVKSEAKKISRELQYAKAGKAAAERRAKLVNERVDALKMQYKKEELNMHYNLGVVYDKAGLYEDAEREYEKCLKIDPRDAGVHYNLGILYDDKLNKNKRALVHYNKYLELHPIGEDAAKVRQWMFRTEVEGRVGAEVR